MAYPVHFDYFHELHLQIFLSERGIVDNEIIRSRQDLPLR